LQALYKATRTLHASMQWLAHVEKPLAVICGDDWFDSDAHIKVSRIFSEQRWLYSCNYFDIVDEVMKSKETCHYIENSLDQFFELILLQ
jgi:hypothetical protein